MSLQIGSDLFQQKRSIDATRISRIQFDDCTPNFQSVRLALEQDWPQFFAAEMIDVAGMSCPRLGTTFEALNQDGAVR